MGASQLYEQIRTLENLCDSLVTRLNAAKATIADYQANNPSAAMVTQLREELERTKEELARDHSDMLGFQQMAAAANQENNKLRKTLGDELDLVKRMHNETRIVADGLREEVERLKQELAAEKTKNLQQRVAGPVPTPEPPKAPTAGQLLEIE